MRSETFLSRWHLTGHDRRKLRAALTAARVGRHARRLQAVLLVAQGYAVQRVARMAWAPMGTQANVPITGENARHVIFGAINIRTGHRVLHRETILRTHAFAAFLRKLHHRYRGRRLWLLLDKHGSHKAIGNHRLARVLRIELVPLPRQCPELNAMDQLWRETKRCVSAPMPSRVVAAWLTDLGVRVGPGMGHTYHGRGGSELASVLAMVGKEEVGLSIGPHASGPAPERAGGAARCTHRRAPVRAGRGACPGFWFRIRGRVVGLFASGAQVLDTVWLPDTWTPRRADRK